MFNSLLLLQLEVACACGANSLSNVSIEYAAGRKSYSLRNVWVYALISFRQRRRFLAEENIQTICDLI
jgi:hypothetical protein